MLSKPTYLAMSAALAMGSTAAHAASLGNPSIAFALGNEGRSLVTVADPSGNPATAVDLSFEGGAVLSLDTLAYRPQTGQLYGYDDFGDTVYEINVMTGQTTAIVDMPGITTNGDAGFDFNNVLDAARIVTAERENVVFFPNKTPPTLEAKTELAFVAGDANEGMLPNIVMNAYTNAVADATTTQQFVLDSDWNILATLGNNAGTLETIGELFLDGSAFDITEDGGFDILSFSEGDNMAYALLTNGADQAIYSVPLMADAMGRVNLTEITGVTSMYGPLDGFAVAPFAGGVLGGTSPVPVPASVAFLGTGLAALAGFRLRKSRRKAA